MRRLTLPLLAVALGLVGCGPVATPVADPAPPHTVAELAPPFAVTAGGQEIDAPLGEKGRPLHDNGFPWVADFDGDGKPDLLVGQQTNVAEEGKKGGRLRFYANTGEVGRPRFGDPLWFDDRNPTGRIPGG